MRVRGGIGTAIAALALAGVSVLATGTAAASPYVHAHRGGSLATKDRGQRPVFGEEVARTANLFTLQDRKVIHLKNFQATDEALEAAGLSE